MPTLLLATDILQTSPRHGATGVCVVTFSFSWPGLQRSVLVEGLLSSVAGPAAAWCPARQPARAGAGAAAGSATRTCGPAHSPLQAAQVRPNHSELARSHRTTTPSALTVSDPVTTGDSETRPSLGCSPATRTWTGRMSRPPWSSLRRPSRSASCRWPGRRRRRASPSAEPASAGRFPWGLGARALWRDGLDPRKPGSRG
jgi:hypothetical protein